MTFLAATVPPSIIGPVLDKFDDYVDDAFFNALSSVPFECSAERMERARLKVSLPAPFGCSLFRAADQGKAAWLSSVAACLSDPLLFRLRGGLAKYIDPAWSGLVEALGGTASNLWSQISPLLPSTAAAFLDGSVFSPVNDGNFKVKISKVALKLLSRVRVERFLALTSVNSLSSSSNLTVSDVLRANSMTFASRLFTSSMKVDTPFVLTNDQYSAWCRSFLGLPPAATVGNSSEQKGFDYPVQRCLAGNHRSATPFLDFDGAHAAAHCPAAKAGRLKKHNYLVRVLARAAKEAGLRVNVEPDTHGLLLGEFPKSECRRIFPKHSSKRYRDKFNEVLNAIDLIASAACEMNDAEKHRYVQARIDDLPSVAREDATGLRIDVAIENEETGETKWVDVTVVHTGADSYQERELKAVGKRQIALQISTSLSLPVPDPLKLNPSPTLVQRETAKVEKYSRLLLIAKKQAAEKKRKQIPTFSTFAVSDYGELSPVAMDLQDWLVNQYRIKCELAGKRADGRRPMDLVRDFRWRLRLGIQLALASGCGEMLNRAGAAWG
jgi:hypothetical protein